MFDFRSRSREEDSILSEPGDQDVALICNRRLRCWELAPRAELGDYRLSTYIGASSHFNSGAEKQSCPESPGGPGPALG